MNTTTYKKLIEATVPCEYVMEVNKQVKLEDDEYYCLMVENDYRKYKPSPHIKGIEATSHVGLVGVEKTSGKDNWYISKVYSERRSILRGSTHIIRIKPDDLNRFCELARNK